MPVASERVPNTALSAEELRTLLLRDFERLITQFSLLSSSAAFPRVAWDIRLSLHLDNSFSPLHETFMQSRAEGQNAIRQQPSLAAVTTIPVVGAERPAFEAKLLHREVASPNEERLRAGLPVPVEVRQSGGHTVTEYLKYPADESLGDGAVAVSDNTAIAAGELNIVLPDAPVTSLNYVASSMEPDASESPEARLARIRAEADALSLAEAERLAKLAVTAAGGNPTTSERLPDAIPVVDAKAKLATVEAEIAKELGLDKVMGEDSPR